MFSSDASRWRGQAFMFHTNCQHWYDILKCLAFLLVKFSTAGVLTVVIILVNGQFKIVVYCVKRLFICYFEWTRNCFNICFNNAMLNDSTDNRLPERLNILIFTYLNFNLVLSIACPMSLLSWNNIVLQVSFIVQLLRRIIDKYSLIIKMFIVYEIL